MGWTGRCRPPFGEALSIVSIVNTCINVCGGKSGGLYTGITLEEEKSSQGVS